MKTCGIKQALMPSPDESCNLQARASNHSTAQIESGWALVTCRRRVRDRLKKTTSISINPGHRVSAVNGRIKIATTWLSNSPARRASDGPGSSSSGVAYVPDNFCHVPVSGRHASH